MATRTRTRGRHALHRTHRPSWLRITGIATILTALLLSCTMSPADSVQPGTKLGAAITAKRTTVDPARAPYGSGPIGNWESNTPTASTSTQFQNVAANNGILIVGDSIANQTSYEFATRMNQQHGLPTAVYNWPGRPTEPVADWVEDWPQRIPDRGIVIASGANDVFNPAGWWQNITRILDVADGRNVYWVSVHVDRWNTTDADRRVADMRNSAWINDQAYALARTRPNLIIVDWHALLSQGYNESRVTTWLTDGVHPTAAGVDGWCDLLELRMGL